VLVLTPLALHEVFGAFTGAAQTHTRAKAALQRVAEVLDAPQVGVGDSPTAAASEEKPSLVIEGLTVGWPGDQPVLSNVNLHVAAGESVAIVGRSGIGKTTLAATIMGLIPPLTGTVTTTGRVRYLAQNAHVFATSISENVRIGCKEATEDEVLTALSRAGLAIPPRRVVTEDGSSLSGGEAQRLALARVLVNHGTPADPATHDLLILDEPSEHLDVETSEALMSDLWATTSGTAKVVITHDPLVMARCDRVWHVG